MSFPIGDWQFWTVTGIALLSAWQLVRPFLEQKAEGEGCPGCDGCGPESETEGPKLVALGRGDRG